MKKIIIPIIQYCLFMTTTVGSMAQTGKFGHILYTVPPGWKESKYQNGVQLVIAPAPKELLTIQILQPASFSGSLEQALEKSYDETCTILQVTKMREVSGKNYDARESKKSFKGWEYVRCSGGIHVNNGTPYPDEYGLDLFVIKVNNRFERIAIVKSRNTCNGLSRYYPSDRLIYKNAIEDFLFSLKFDDWEEPPVEKGSFHGEGINGVYQGLSMSVGTPKPGASLGAEMNVRQLIFFSNEQAYFGKYFPIEGLDELNTRIAAENNRRDWGTYSFNSGKGILKMPYADIPLRMEGEKLVITSNKTDHVFIKGKPVDDAKLNGTYTLAETYGMIPTINFTSAGKFVDKGALRILYHEYIDCLNPVLTQGSGSYEIKNHSAIFTYDDGRKIKIAVTGSGFDSSQSPKELVLSFNEDVMRKQ